MAKQLKASDILKKALDKFGPNGEHWGQHAYQHGHGRTATYCALGAIWKASRDSDKGAAEFLSRVIRGGVTAWNDRQGRKFADVRAKFKEAIAVARANEKAEARQR